MLFFVARLIRTDSYEHLSYLRNNVRNSREQTDEAERLERTRDALFTREKVDGKIIATAQRRQLPFIAR